MENQNQKIRVKYPFLYGYQADGVQELLDCDKVLLGSTVGLGKSVQAIVWAMEQTENVTRAILIVCPAPLIKQWEKEVNKFFPDTTVTKYIGAKKQRKHIYDEYLKTKGIIIISYEMLRSDIYLIKDVVFSCVIFDEIHKLKNWKSKTHNACKLIKSSKKIGMTATPLVNSPIELFAIVNFLRPFWINYNQFTRDHCVYTFVWNGNREIRTISGYKNLDLLHQRLKPFMVRHKKEDVLPQLPPRTYKNIYCSMSTEQQRLHNYYINAACNAFKENKKNSLLAFLTMARMSADSPLLIKQSTSEHAIPVNKETSNKVNTLLELIPTLEGKTIIFSQWSKMSHIIHNAIPQSMLITGQTKDKDKLIEEFKINSSTVLVTTDCLGVGVNLDCAQNIINFDSPYSSYKLEQRSGRIDRVTQKNKLLIITLISENSIEEKVLEIVNQKSEYHNIVIDGEKLIEWANKKH